MSLTHRKSDLKKHLSRHIHIENDGHPLSPATVPDVIESSKDQGATSVAALPSVKPLV